jgi:hypothetical protein
VVFISIIALAFVVSAVLLARLHIRTGREPEGWHLEMRYGLLPWVAPHWKTIAAKSRKTRSPRRRGPFVTKRVFDIAPQLAMAVWHGLTFLFPRIRLDRCDVAGTLAASDPAATGIVYALLEALAGALNQFSQVHISVYPLFFDEEGKQLSFEIEASATAFALLTFPLVTLYHAPKKALARIVVDSIRR